MHGKFTGFELFFEPLKVDCRVLLLLPFSGGRHVIGLSQIFLNYWNTTFPRNLYAKICVLHFQWPAPESRMIVVFL